MKQQKKKIQSIIIIVFLVFLAYSSLFGRLFPFSPIIIGFEKKEFNKAIIYYHQSDNINEFLSIDSIMEGVEKFHRLAFKRKVKIILAESDKEYKRYTGTSARFVTQPLMGRIFISNRAKIEYRDKKIQFYTYIKHELSHSILYQNISFFRSLRYPSWFMEGIAMYSSKQVGSDGYYSYKQTNEKIKEGYFVEPKDWGTIITSKGKTVVNCKLENKYWFIYSEFALIINNLINQFGEDKFIDFLKGSLNTNDFYPLFKITFGQSFDNYLKTIQNTAKK